MRYLFLLALVFSSTTALASTDETPTDRFENQTIIEVTGIATPKVVQFETSEDLGRFQSLKDLSTGQVIPHRVTSLQVSQRNGFVVSSAATQKTGSPYALSDLNYEKNGLAFDTKRTLHSLVIEPNSALRQDVSGLRFTLGENVFRPKYVSIKADFGDGELVNFLDRVDYQNELRFAKISPNRLEVTFESPHYLALNEIQLLGPADKKSTALVFYGTEGGKYELLSNPASGQKRIYSNERLPLRTDKDTPVLSLPQLTTNDYYNDDLDDDGLVDSVDLCPNVADASNADVDSDGRGDACQDPDQDNLMSYKDNCPFVYNRDQSDIDADGIGDVCDTSDERVSENMGEWVLNGVFVLVALMLLLLVAKSVKNQSKQED